MWQIRFVADEDFGGFAVGVLLVDLVVPEDDVLQAQLIRQVEDQHNGVDILEPSLLDTFEYVLSETIPLPY